LSAYSNLHCTLPIRIIDLLVGFLVNITIHELPKSHNITLKSKEEATQDLCIYIGSLYCAVIHIPDCLHSGNVNHKRILKLRKMRNAFCVINFSSF
jgi:hypothetical protein